TQTSASVDAYYRHRPNALSPARWRKPHCWNPVELRTLDRERIDLTRPYSQKSFFRSKHISIPHPPDQLPTICHQPFGTMPTIFLWKERHKNDDGSLPTHGQGTGRIRVFAHGSESRRFSHCHTVFVCACAREVTALCARQDWSFSRPARTRKSERFCHDT